MGALTTPGLFMWGVDAEGEFGNGTTSAPVPNPTAIPSITNLASITMSFSSTGALTTSGKALCWGNNSYGQLGNGTMNNISTTPTSIVWP